MFGYPGSYHQWMFNTSEIPALEKLAQTYHIAETWDEYENDYKYYVQTKGTHANVYSYLMPWELENGGDRLKIFLHIPFHMVGGNQG